MTVLLLVFSLLLLNACTSAFMYLLPGETHWAHAHSSIANSLARRQGKREQMESMSQTMTPSDLAGIYGYPFGGNGGAGLIIGVSMFGNCTYGESDLAMFNQHFGLPPCTFANGCLSKAVIGTAALPNYDDWNLECSLDLQTIHSTAPGAQIVIFTTGQDTNEDIGQTLVVAGARSNYVTASWGSPEYAWTNIEASLQSSVNNFGTSFFTSSGDIGGQPVQYWPASSPTFITAGGTTVHGYGSSATETAWSGSGGGCSTVFQATAAQKADPGYLAMGCNGMKGVPDLAYDADDIGSGIDGVIHGKWVQFGGTSAAAPRAAAKAAVVGFQVTPNIVYGGAMQFRDVVSGSNGRHSAVPGYDLVTGKGAWINTRPGTYAAPRPYVAPPSGGNEGCGNDP